MKRVAFCLKGAVSKEGGHHDRFLYKDDLYRDGRYIDYIAVRNSIFKHIVSVNENFVFDFFIHSWNEDLQQNLLEIYNPKKYCFENNTYYNNIITSVISKPEDFGGVSGSLSLKKSLELKEFHEFQNDIEYDIVIIYRFDVLIWKDLILSDYDTENFIYVNGWDGSCMGDFHFVMSNNNSRKFRYLYDSLKLTDNTHKFHFWIKYYLLQVLKTELKEDGIIAGLYQEHMRVIGNNFSLKEIAKQYE
jgi:hypothetical protein